jgi:hypothetical protein
MADMNCNKELAQDMGTGGQKETICNYDNFLSARTEKNSDNKR